MSDEYGRPIAGVPLAWVRGEASFDGEWVTLIDPEGATVYRPFDVSNLPFDLAAVETPEDAVAFVGKYGLLRHGPSASEHRERFREWVQEIFTLRMAIDLYRCLHGIRDNKEEAVDEMRAVLKMDDSVPFVELVIQAQTRVIEIVSEGLAGVEEGLTSVAGLEGYDPFSSFVLMARADTLLGWAYHHLAMAIVPQTRLAACPDCGRNFPVRHHNQKYCSTTCSNRTRRRRADNKAKGGKS